MAGTRKTETLDDLRALLAADGMPPKDPNQDPPETEEAAAEVVVPASEKVPASGETQEAEQQIEAEAKTAEPKQQPKDPEEDQLPHGVKKRLAEEATLQADYERRIKEAVSARKAKQREFEKADAAPKGEEPVKTTGKEAEQVVAPNPRPKRPEIQSWAKEFAAKNGRDATNEEWYAELAAHEERLEAYRDRLHADQEARLEDRVKVASKQVVEQELTARQQADLKRQREEYANKAWKDAVAEHGEEVLEAAKDTVVKAISTKPLIPIQHAISDMDNWARVTIKLAAEPELLAQVVDTWKQSPIRAAFLLRDIEQSLKPPVVEKKNPPAVSALKPLPRPPGKVAGGATVSEKVLDFKDPNVDKDPGFLDGLRGMVNADRVSKAG